MKLCTQEFQQNTIKRVWKRHKHMRKRRAPFSNLIKSNHIYSSYISKLLFFADVMTINTLYVMTHWMEPPTHYLITIINILKAQIITLSDQGYIMVQIRDFSIIQRLLCYYWSRTFLSKLCSLDID